MYTQCPKCLTIYQLDGSELSGTRGNVYCNDCKVLFNALRTLTPELPPMPTDRLPAHPAQIAPPLLERPAHPPHPPQVKPLAKVRARPAKPVEQERPQRHSEPTHARARLVKRPQPAFTTRHHDPRSEHNWPWVLGSALLLFTLAGEFAWGDRKELLDNSSVRAWVDPVCAWMGCRLPLRHDPSALELLSRDIRPHPSVPGALIISATLRNDAAFTQSFPVVEIALSDFDEKTVAMRRFQPHEYIDDPYAISEGLAPGTSTALVFEVADPGKDAVAFEFRFQ
ncbi:MAG: DUF3426 domain-containing protein [Rhodanobacter sp.]|jgi:predicted Zn finger-like uncharacterized protein|nr:DUF3426 domain-containing protein [Rhodanobacter sp.]